jgi:hypothetical protein
MTAKSARITTGAQLEFKRMAMDEARRKGNTKRYSELRTEVDVLITKMQKIGRLGILDMDTQAGPEEDE